MIRMVICSRQYIGKYTGFIRDLYKGDPRYTDAMTSLAGDILFGRSIFCKNADIIPVIIVRHEEIIAVCTYIWVPKMPQLIQIAFFEAKENQEEAIDLIMDQGQQYAKRRGATHITIGINGHMNYGMGLLADHFEETVSFGSAYNPPYYVGYFKKYMPLEHTMTSYLTDMVSKDFEKEKKLAQKVRKRFTFRKANYSLLLREVKIYNELNNRCFQQHPFYFNRSLEEDLAVFKHFSMVSSGENLIFAEQAGNPIGFMLWYPDYNELILSGGDMGMQSIVRYRDLQHTITKFKIVSVGIIPAYQGTGAILGLFDECLRYTQGRYKWCESGFIIDSNTKSKGLGVRWADQEYKHYKIFEIPVR